MKRCSIFVLVIFAWFGWSCRSSHDSPATPGPVATETPSPTALGTSTATMTPTQAATSTATPTPSPTPIPVATVQCPPTPSPPSCGAPASFGYGFQGPGNTGSGSVGSITYEPETLPVSGIISEIEVYGFPSGTAGEARVALYGGNNLLTQSCPQTVLPGQWNVFDIPDVAVTAGTYRLAVQTAPGVTNALDLQQFTSPATPVLRSTTSVAWTPYGPFPATLPTGTLLIGDFRSLSIEAVYCP